MKPMGRRHGPDGVLRRPLLAGRHRVGTSWYYSGASRGSSGLRGSRPGPSAPPSPTCCPWAEAKATDWQPTTLRDQRSRSRSIAGDLGRVRLVDLGPSRIDAWLARMRRSGVGEGAIRGRVHALRAAVSWGISRRMLRSNPVAEAAPRTQNRRRTVRPEPEQVVALLAAAGKEGTRAPWGCGWRR